MIHHYYTRVKNFDKDNKAKEDKENIKKVYKTNSSRHC